MILRVIIASGPMLPHPGILWPSDFVLKKGWMHPTQGIEIKPQVRSLLEVPKQVLNLPQACPDFSGQ